MGSSLGSDTELEQVPSLISRPQQKYLLQIWGCYTPCLYLSYLVWASGIPWLIQPHLTPSEPLPFVSGLDVPSQPFAPCRSSSRTSGSNSTFTHIITYLQRACRNFWVSSSLKQLKFNPLPDHNMLVYFLWCVYMAAKVQGTLLSKP